LFSQTATQEIDVNNIKTSLSHISDFISNRELKNNREKDILFLKGFGQIAFDFVSAIFKGGLDQLKTEKNKTFRKLIKDKFMSKVSIPNKGKKTNISMPSKLVSFLKLLPSQLPPRLSKEVLAKSKFHGKNAPTITKRQQKLPNLLMLKSHLGTSTIS